MPEKPTESSNGAHVEEPGPTSKMPRGATPTPRNELAASLPYRPMTGAPVFVPSGEFPTPNHELAAAEPYGAGRTAPESFLAWPIRLSPWREEHAINSSWAEEAFAKACVEPHVFIPPDLVLVTLRECGSSNFAHFIQTHGFQMDHTAYLDGPFQSVDWTNTLVLNDAISNVGPVKIGIGSANLDSSPHGRVTRGQSGWTIYGLPPDESENLFASLCGYGALGSLVDLFNRHAGAVTLPLGMPADLCYAMFVWGSIGIIDRQSLMNIIGEAWVRNPTTIVKDFGG